MMARVPRQIEQHGERLHAEVGMRLEPEAVDVLGELDAEIGALEIGAEGILEMARHPLVLKGLSDRRANREAFAVLHVEVFAGVVMQLALAGDAVERGSIKGKRQHVFNAVGGEAALQRPMAIGLLGTLGAIDACQERLDHIYGGTLDLGSRRTLYRDVFPHDLIDLPRKPQAGGLLLTSSRHRTLVVSTGTPPAQIGTYRQISR